MTALNFVLSFIAYMLAAVGAIFCTCFVLFVLLQEAVMSYFDKLTEKAIMQGGLVFLSHNLNNVDTTFSYSGCWQRTMYNNTLNTFICASEVLTPVEAEKFYNNYADWGDLLSYFSKWLKCHYRLDLLSCLSEVLTQKEYKTMFIDIGYPLNREGLIDLKVEIKADNVAVWIRKLNYEIQLYKGVNDVNLIYDQLLSYAD